MMGNTTRALLAATAAIWLLAEPAAAVPANFKTKSDSYVKAAYPADGPGAAVIVVDDGKVVYAAGQGLADLETGRRITPATVFRLGSITKQFTAAVVLQLAAEGKLSLDDPLSRFFPDWRQPGARATVRQLLNHSSGIQDLTKIPGFMGSEQTLRFNTTADLIGVVRGRPSVSEPGTKWEYNNSGYIVLGAIAEKLTGKAWHEVIEDRIAKPLGLASIRYAVTAEAAGETARGYSKVDGRYRPARGVHISVAHAAGGLVGSVRDMAKWAQALHHGRVVGPAHYKEMTSPVRLADGSTESYGMGLRLRRIRGRPALVHGGAGRGLDTDSVYIPSEDLFIAVFSNTDDAATDPSLFTRRLAALALDKPIPDFARVDVDPKSVEPLFGAYSERGDEPTRFFSRGGKYFLSQGEAQVELVPAGNDRFFIPTGELMWVRFDRKPDGAHVMELDRPDLTQPQRAVRTGEVPPPLAVAAAVLQSYAGTYKTEVGILTVAVAGGQLTVRANDGEPMPMRAISETEFMVDEMRSKVIFHPEKGAVNKLTVRRGARELHGVRVN